ncbi:MAG: hypothetical protein K0R62_1601 [Nonomuraea muscovyensis]|jgi:hypothetical protein|nr:hypothetical protein [Nonomuraea muscovyensis]
MASRLGDFGRVVGLQLVDELPPGFAWNDDHQVWVNTWGRRAMRAAWAIDEAEREGDRERETRAS